MTKPGKGFKGRTMMTRAVTESPMLGGGAPLPHEPSSIGDFVLFNDRGRVHTWTPVTGPAVSVEPGI